MQVTDVWPFFLLVLIPIIVLLYILKQKGKDEEVGSVMLWQETIRNTEATTPWEKLKHQLLMYVQIFTVLLLVLALASPYLKRGGAEYAQVILVLDNTGSMQTQYEKDVTRFEEAKQQAVAYIDSLPEASVVTVVTAADGGELVVSNARDRKAAKRAISQLVCTDLAGNVTGCIHLLQSVCAQQENYGMTVFSDSPVELLGMTATVVNLYTKTENAAVSYVSSAYNADGTLTALAKVCNYGDEDRTEEINLYGDGTLLAVTKVTVPAQASAIAYFEQVTFTGNVLTAQINEADALERDNQASVVLDAQEKKRVLLVTAGNTFLEKALTTMSGIEVYKTTDSAVVGKNETFDLYVFDGVLPDTAPEQGNMIFWNPQMTSSTTEGEIVIQAVRERIPLSFVRSVLSTDLAEDSFGVNAATIFQKPDWAQEFLTYQGECAGYYGEHNGRKLICVGFDIHDTDFALSADFPVLMHHMLAYTVENGMLDVAAYVAGDKVPIHAKDRQTQVEVTLPDGGQSVLDASLTSKVFTQTRQAGMYSVSQVVGEDTLQEAFYVAFPVDQESNPEGIVAGEEAADVADTMPGGGVNLRRYILFALLLLLVAEWMLYVKEY